jgi:putative tryptophan/tyrosine transport system substrate-binding protein
VTERKGIPPWRVLACAVGLGLTSALPAAGAKVTAIVSRALGPYQEAMAGFGQSGAFQVLEINLEGDAQKGQRVLGELSPATCDLLVPCGTEALVLLKDRWPNVPVVYTMVLEPPAFAGGRSSGVLMQIPLNEQIARLPKLFPGAKKIGVIYNPFYTKKTITQARDLVSGYGLTLIAIAIEKPEEVGMALTNLKGAEVDVVWSVIDPTMSQPAVMAEVIQYTLAHKLPFVAMASYQVKAGALACFGVDYRDIGLQTAELAKWTLSASDRGGRVETPRKVIVYVNGQTQRTLGLDALSRLPEVQLVK